MKPVVFIHSYEENDPTKGVKARFVLRMQENFETVTYEELIKEPTKNSDVKGAVLLPSRMKLFDELKEKMTSLCAVSAVSVGLDKIPVDYFRERNIAVGYCPAFKQQNKTVADHAILLMLAVARKFIDKVNSLKLRHQQETPEFTWNALGHDVSNWTMGIIGLGRIGVEIAKRARAFEMKVVYHNRSCRNDLPEELQLKFYEKLHEMLPEVDVLVIACALNDQSTALISHAELALMKNSALVINIARGKIIDTESLVTALQNKQIAGAGLDVTDPEPLPVGHPLYNMPNVIVTPHTASHTFEAKDEIWEMVKANLTAALIEHKPMPYAVTDV